MALTVTSLGSTGTTTTATTLVLTSAAAVAVGDLIVIGIAIDNSGGTITGTVPTSIAVTDSGSNRYFLAFHSLSSPGGTVNGGAYSAVYSAVATTALTTSSTITVTTQTAAIAMVGRKVTAAAGNYASIRTSNHFTATASATTLAATSPSVNVGEALLTFAALQAGNAAKTMTVTGDSDTTNGSWTAIVKNQGNNSATSASDMTVASQTKIQTTTASTQTWDLSGFTAATGRAAVNIVVAEIPNPTGPVLAWKGATDLGMWGGGSGSGTRSLTVPVQTGDLIVVYGMGESNGSTMSGLTDTVNSYTLRRSSVNANESPLYLWTAVAASTTTLTLTVTVSNTGNQQGLLVEVWRSHAGLGNTAITTTAGTARTLALTASAANSAMSMALADWGATDLSARVGATVNSSTGVEHLYFRDVNGGRYSALSRHWDDVGATGSKSVGYSSPTSGTNTIAAVEILKASSALSVAASPVTVNISGQTLNRTLGAVTNAASPVTVTVTPQTLDRTNVAPPTVVALSTTPVTSTDNFTRADSATTIGGSWGAPTNSNVFGIISNKAYHVSGNYGVVTLPAAGFDQDITFTPAGLTANGQLGGVVRFLSVFDYLYIEWNEDFLTWNVYKVVGLTGTLLGNTGLSNKALPVRMRVIDTTLSVYNAASGQWYRFYGLTEANLLIGPNVGLSWTGATPNTTSTWDDFTVTHSTTPPTLYVDPAILNRTVGPVTVAALPVVVNISAQATNRTTGPISVAASPVIVDVTEQTLGRTLGPITNAALPVTLNVNKQTLGRTLGTANVAATPATVAVAAQTLATNVPSPQSVAASPAVINIAEQTLGLTMGGTASVAASPAVVVVVGQPMGRTGAGSVAALPVTVSVSGQTLNRTLGTATAAASPATVTTTALTLGTDTAVTVAASPASIAVTPLPIDLAAGGATLTMPLLVTGGGGAGATYNFLGTTAPVGAAQDAGDTSQVNLGIRINVGSSPQWITKIRAWVTAAATSGATFQAGIYSLFSYSPLASGSIGSLPFVDGWVEITLSTPYELAANTTYVIGWYYPGGHYPATSQAYNPSTYDNTTIGGITVPESSGSNDASGQGLYNYTTGLGRPDSSFNNTKYWVDFEFTDTDPSVGGGSVVYAPTVTTGAAPLTAPLLTTTTVLIPPASNTLVTLAAPLLTTTSTLFLPACQIWVAPPLLVTTSALLAPTITGASTNAATPATLTVTVSTLGRTVGGSPSAALTPVVVTTTVIALTTFGGPASINIAPAAVTVAPQTLARTVGPISVAASPVTVAVAPSALVRSSGPTTPAASPATVSLSVQPMSTTGSTSAAALPAVVALSTQAVGLTVGSAPLSPPLLAAPSALYVPFTGSGFNLSVTTPIAAPSALYPPVITWQQSLTVPLLTAPASTLAPTVTVGSAFIINPVLAAPATVLTPSLAIGALAAPTITTTTTFFGATLIQQQYLTAPVLAAPSAVIAPSVTTTTALTAPLLTTSSVLLAPSAARILAPPTIVAPETVLPPTVINRQMLGPPTLAVPPTLVAPFVGTLGSMAPPVVVTTTALHGPRVNLEITAPLLTTTPLVYPPGGVTVYVVLPLVGTTATIITPSITTVVRLDAPLLSAQATVIAPSLSTTSFLPVPLLSDPPTLYPSVILVAGAVGVYDGGQWVFGSFRVKQKVGVGWDENPQLRPPPV